eukprot:gene25176-11001_t
MALHKQAEEELQQQRNLHARDMETVDAEHTLDIQNINKSTRKKNLELDYRATEAQTAMEKAQMDAKVHQQHMLEAIDQSRQHETR